MAEKLDIKTFAFAIGSARYVVDYADRVGMEIYAEIDGLWRHVVDYKCGILSLDIDAVMENAGDKYEERFPGAFRRALEGFDRGEESPPFEWFTRDTRFYLRAAARL